MENQGACPTTCVCFFGGLMCDQPVAPEDWRRENPGIDPSIWQLNADGVEIERYLCGVATEKMKEDEDVLIAGSYREYLIFDFFKRN